MKSREIDIQRKAGLFYTTLSFTIPDENLATCTSSVLEYIVKKYSVPEQNIVDVQFSKITVEGKILLSVVIKYCNYNSYELEALDEKEQIRFILKFMGYTDKAINDISYKKYWADSNDLVWVIKLSDPNYDFDPDESLCERDYTNSIRSAIENALGFDVIVEFI